MATVSLLEFRRHTRSVVRRLRQGQRMILSYRGKPVARMEPILDTPLRSDRRIYYAALELEPDPARSNGSARAPGTDT